MDYFLANDFAEVLGAATSVLVWLDTVMAQCAFTSVAVWGFSQGMAMATTLMRLHPEQLPVGVGLSGFVLHNELLGAMEPLAARNPFLRARDTTDIVIHPDATELTAEWLAANTELSNAHYSGLGHKIGADELSDVSFF